MKQLASLLLAALLAGCTSITIRSTFAPTMIPIGNLPLTKFAMLTGEAETETEVSPKNNATVTAIVATKFALGTQAAETMTAMPTLTSTPAIPPNSPLCTPGDLKTAFSTNVAMQSILLGVSLTNTSHSPCYMQAWPQVILVDGQGNPLNLEYGYFDFHNDASTAATEEAREATAAKAGLWPGWTARFTLMWGNWCGTPITSGVVIRLTLLDQSAIINVPTDISAGGECESPDYRSHVGISILEVVPPANQ